MQTVLNSVKRGKCVSWQVRVDSDFPATGGHWLRMELTQVTAACSAEVWLSSGPSPLASRLVVSAETLMLVRTLSPSLTYMSTSNPIAG